MILTVVRISLLRLWHNRAELVLTFVVPLIFFSIFAWIFGSRDSDGGTPRLKVALVDTVGDARSENVCSELDSARSLRVMDKLQIKESAAIESVQLISRGRELVRHGKITAAIILSTDEDNVVQAQILADTYDQVATQILTAVVQQTLMTAKSTEALPGVGQDASAVQQASSIVPKSVAIEMPEVPITDVMGENKANPVIAMYAAGIAVMFALFSATTASGSLLEERENSTLERLLTSRLTIDQLLMGKWLYLTGLGCLQISLMFLFGWLAFGVELWSHMQGFMAMTLATSAAAASFALMLATICKTRVQLGWTSTIVILVMSALGGSMVPRYLMSEAVQKVGMITFNAWALEGYNKIFWRDLDLLAINRELAVLVFAAFVMLITARLLAIRWERA